MSEVTNTAAKAEKAYSLETLRKDSVKLFGVTSSTFDGALGGKTGQMTISEAKKIIEDWKKGVVK